MQHLEVSGTPVLYIYIYIYIYIYDARFLKVNPVNLFVLSIILFKSYWLRDAPTFNNCTLCPHCIYVIFYLSENKQRLVPLTA